MKDFVHLRVRTEYSLLNSVTSIADIANFVKSTDAKAIACMDDCNISSAFAFSNKISSCKSKPIIGLNVFITLPSSIEKKYQRFYSLGLLAINEQGYKNLIEIVYKLQFNSDKSQEINSVKFSDILDFNEGLICLSGGYNGMMGTEILHGNKESVIEHCRHLQNVFGNRFYIELTRHGRLDEQTVEDKMLQIAKELKISVVATNDVYFESRKKYDSYDAISCVRDGTFVSQTDRIRINEEYYLKSTFEMRELFKDIPEAIDNTIIIAKRCSFFLKKNKPMLPSFIDHCQEDDLFDSLIHSGLEKRLSKIKNLTDEKIIEYKDRLSFEAKVIKKMEFVGYFLIVQDFINWAKDNNIPVGPGRGSGAGSLVAYSLGITNVDPISYGLLFERFLNPERVSMPDFDIDFCQTKREHVIEYVKNKYGEDRVASIITFGALQAKAALKDIGRVLQLPYGQIDSICKLIPFNPIDPVKLSRAIELDDNLKMEMVKDDSIRELIEIALNVEGMYRHSSTHAAGIVISGKPLKEIVPVHRDVNSSMGLGIIGFNMKDAESIGLVKFDFLGLKTLSVIAEAVEVIKENRGINIDIDDIDMHDSKTLQLLKSTKTKGIFQMEATVPREAMQRMEVNGVPDLAAITSLNRPGPMENIPVYIKRKNGHEKIDYPHPLAEKLLEETYGIIIYQEQVMRMAQILANYSLGAADLLRRAMGKKIQSEMDTQRSIFVKGAKDNGIDETTASTIFDTIDKFAGYGFNKSHAVAYSFISYQTAYLKANFQEEFFVAMMNLDLDNTEKIVEIINEAKSMGTEILLPDVNCSIEKFTVEGGNKIRYAMSALKSVGLDSVKKIVSERQKGGDFTDIFNFLKRCSSVVNKKILENFIKSGTLLNLCKSRKALLDNDTGKNLENLLKYANAFNTKSSFALSENLFGDEVVQDVKKPTIDYNIEESVVDKMNMEYESFGFYMSVNPISEYEDKLKQVGNGAGIVSSANLDMNVPKNGYKTLFFAGVVTKVRQRAGKKGRFAFLSVADSVGMLEFAIFNDDLISKRRDIMVEGKTIVLNVSARVDEETGLRLSVNDFVDIENINELSTKVKEKRDSFDFSNSSKSGYGNKFAKKDNNNLQKSEKNGVYVIDGISNFTTTGSAQSPNEIASSTYVNLCENVANLENISSFETNYRIIVINNLEIIKDLSYFQNLPQGEIRIILETPLGKVPLNIHTNVDGLKMLKSITEMDIL